MSKLQEMILEIKSLIKNQDPVFELIDLRENKVQFKVPTKEDIKIDVEATPDGEFEFDDFKVKIENGKVVEFVEKTQEEQKDEKDVKIAELEAALADKNAEVAAREADIASMKEQIAVQQAEIEKKEKEMEEVEKDLSEIKNFYSKVNSQAAERQEPENKPEEEKGFKFKIK